MNIGIHVFNVCPVFFLGRGGEVTYNKHKYYYSGNQFICNCSTAKSVEDDESENRISPTSLPGP